MSDPAASLVQSLLMGADLGQMLLHAARIYETDIEALAQSVENSRDAGAKHILVELRPDAVTVTDDGIGMVGRMRTEDQAKLKSWLSGQRDFTWKELVAQMAPSSRQSLELMMCAFARSTKVDDSTMLGEKHWGSLAHYQLADQTVVYTRPDETLQSDAGLPLREDEVFLLRFPTTTQLQSNELEFGLVGPIANPVRGPWGGRFFHGTQVVIRGLHPGFERSLAPRLLVEHLSNHFGEDIRRGLVIEVVDRLTEEGRRAKGGRVLKATTPEFKGVCLMDRDLTTTHGKHTFHVQLFYLAGGGTNLSPKLQRKGSGVRPLRDLSEEFLRQAPWNRLEGTVAAPDDLEWSSSKSLPLQSSRTYRHWMAGLRALGEELENLIAAADKRSRERIATRFSGEVVDAVLAAMAGSTIFGDQPIGTLPRVEKKKKTSHREKVERQLCKRRIEATVLDEHDAAFEGATIELRCGEQLIGTKITGSSGYVAFPDLTLRRRYLLRLTSVPADCVVDGEGETDISLTLEEPGHRHVFHVHTGRPPKAVGEGSVKLDRTFRPQLWIRDIPDVDPTRVIFRERLPGLIEINAANASIAAALEDSDRTGLDHLVSYCCAAAIASWMLKGQSLDFVLQAAGQLCAGIYENLSESRKKRGKKKL